MRTPNIYIWGLGERDFISESIALAALRIESYVVDELVIRSVFYTSKPGTGHFLRFLALALIKAITSSV